VNIEQGLILFFANALIRGFQSWRDFCVFFAKAATGLKVLWMSLLAQF